MFYYKEKKMKNEIDKKGTIIIFSFLAKLKTFIVG